jgi:hypothetical protein
MAHPKAWFMWMNHDKFFAGRSRGSAGPARGIAAGYAALGARAGGGEALSPDPTT